jgi:1-acyl-sn-glycerol-3-phosphate acyltransferase
MRRVTSTVFWLLLGVACVVNMAIAALLFVLTTPFDPDRRINHAFSCFWAWLTTLTPGWDVRVTGRRHIQPRTGYVLVANHTSVADIVLCFVLFKQFKWVSKASNFKVPILGWNMRLCRYIPLVRGERRSIVQMMMRCEDWLRRGMPIMMFPEGTRSKDGQCQAFKPGAFELALSSGVPVVPIAIHGGHALIPKNGASFAIRAKLCVEVLEPISPAGFADSAEYATAVRSKIVAALERGAPERRRALDEQVGRVTAR